MLGGNLPTRNDKNVMEIILEKDERGVFNASDEEVAKALSKLGADLRPGVHIEGVQICPMGKNVIQVTLNKNVEIDRFCKKDLFELKPGLRISQIRPSGKREVILTIKGLHPNSLDDTVLKYLKCFGKVEKMKVIMDTFREGPLAGLQNGTRKYTMEIRPELLVGTSHIIDGHKVNLSYPGQRKFCFRCYKVDRDCPGSGIARDCQAAGGEKVLLTDHMRVFWNKINFQPDKEMLLEPVENEDNNVEVQVGGVFTPKVKPVETENALKYGAVSVKWFPKRADHGDIKKFLVEKGLSCDHEDVNIKDNGQVIINNLCPEMCKQLAENISGKLFMNKKMIYCQPIVLSTPVKIDESLPRQTSAPESPAPAPVNLPNSVLATEPATAGDVQKDSSSCSTKSKLPARPPTPLNLATKLNTATGSRKEKANNMDEFEFTPIKSKFYDDSEASDLDRHGTYQDESDVWLNKNSKQRKKKDKRKQTGTQLGPATFKKADKKCTP